MAASSKVRGYECEFIDQPVSEDFRCKFCNYVARDLNLTNCCGETFCQACIAQVLRDKKPCPNCETVEFTAYSNAKYQKRILALRVRCTMKDRGCDWDRELEGLDAHLDVDTGDCQYVDVPCPVCDQQVQKRELATHCTDACSKRDYNCRYCGFSGTYEVVCNDHWPECEQYPIPCPNYCGLVAIERCTLEDHLKFCPTQEVECDLAHAGCTEKFLRQDLERHMEENTQKHLVLMSAATLRITQECEMKLQEKLRQHCKQLQERDQKVQEQLQQKSQEAEAKTTQLQQQVEEKLRQIQIQFEQQREEFQKQLHQQREEFQESLRQKDQEIGELKQQVQEKDKEVGEEFHRQQEERDREIRGVKEQLQQKRQQIQEAEVKVTGLQLQVEEKHLHIDQIRCHIGIPPHRFTMPNFSHNERWRTPPLHTHLCGYKFYIGVRPNGWGAGSAGTHVSVFFYQLRGEFDNQLPWPTRCTVTLELLNQHRDQDHIAVTKEFQLIKIEKKEEKHVDTFSDHFVAHKDLGWNADRQTQYLKDNCLKFRVTRVCLF